MKIGIIDLGTNTFNLLIAEQDENGLLNILLTDKIAVKLGEGGINQNIIKPKPFERGLAAMRQHKKTLVEQKVKNIKAFATSAIRSATNGLEFKEKVRQETGIDIEVINGNREAELIYKGVKQAIELDDNYSLIMDIGGGSTEFIICSQQRMLWKKSFNLGASRLLEKFKPSEPIKQKEKEELEAYLNTELQDLWKAAKKLKIERLIGASGSFDSFTEMICYKENFLVNIKKIKMFDLPLEKLSTLHEELLRSTREERLKMPGLVEMRVDMIVISSILTHLVINTLQLKQIQLSTYALKEGAISELINLKK